MASPLLTFNRHVATHPEGPAMRQQIVPKPKTHEKSAKVGHTIDPIMTGYLI
jgi:hypothetical protein